MKERKIVAKVAFLGMFATTLSGFVATAPAAHAASCYGSTCDGADSVAQGCSADAITAYNTVNGVKKYVTFTTAGYKVELRYSDACYAFWTRVTNVSDPGGSGGIWGKIAGYSNRTWVHPWFSSEKVVPQTVGSNSRTVMWGRRSSSQYGWSAMLIAENHTFGQSTWPVTYWD